MNEQMNEFGILQKDFGKQQTSNKHEQQGVTRIENCYTATTL